MMPGWNKKHRELNPATKRLKDSHNRIFGTAAMKEFSPEQAQKQRQLDLRGRDWDLVSFKDNSLKLTKKDGSIFHFK